MGGAGPIAYSAVMAEAERFDMGRDEADWFVELVTAMDRAFLKWVEDRRETSGTRDLVTF